ncbi:hypothetical protein QBC42DRAFT_270854 [Cladorrhinum samala]|uniref:Dihydroneopterin aldolase/epimerase domain-containing protein n=1 Tax=Cladorrhinum samala TaxID=585594 RepID=A0AAV9HM88_9PEZI|nr:hypothetical protein QBC42DRAFT_270854 [Cladorrhinum samala]
MSSHISTLKTTFAVRTLAAELPAIVRVSNLQCLLSSAGHDAWNRPAKTQPCLLSAEVGFSSPFESAAASDKLGEDTVHYGTLSKALLASLDSYAPASTGDEADGSVQDVLAKLWGDLTGQDLEANEKEGVQAFFKKGTLGKTVRLLSVTVTLPKASLLGEGVSYTATAVFGEESGSVEARALQMKIVRLRVPTLIGVNKNEREAKQMVVTTVTLEGLNRKVDVFTKVEGIVVKALEESSFETLEALGSHLIDRVEEGYVNAQDYHVHILMEKPIAVPLADCPIVEVRRLVKDYHR